MQTQYIYLVLFAIYAAVIVAIGTIFFKWDIGSIHVRMARRLWVAALAPSALSLIVGLALYLLGCLYTRPIAAEHFAVRNISAECLLAVVFAMTAYFGFDEVIQRWLKPGFLRYRSRRARRPR